MKVLFVTLRALEINSSVTISNLGLIKGLLELNCEVDLLIPSISSNLKQYEDVKNIYENVNLIRISKNTVYEKMVTGKRNLLKDSIIKLLRKAYYKISLYDNTINLLKKADKDILGDEEYDLILSTSDPKTSHLFVEKLVKQGLKYKHWIQHWGDPMALDITKENIYPKWYVNYIEQKIISQSNFTVYVSPLTEKAQKRSLSEIKEKIKFIPLPYYEERKYDLKYEPNNRNTIGYFGDYNSKVRNIEPLYSLCNTSTNYKLIIAGGTDLKLTSKDNIKIFNRKKQEEIQELEKEVDILVCICNKSGTQIPGKVYYYASTNKPILVILDGEYREEIKEFLVKFNRFELCENNTKSIEDALERIRESNKSYEPCTEFSPKNVASKILELIGGE